MAVNPFTSRPCSPYCRLTELGQGHTATHPLELYAISSLCVQIVTAKGKEKKKGAASKQHAIGTGATVMFGVDPSQYSSDGGSKSDDGFAYSATTNAAESD